MVLHRFFIFCEEILTIMTLSNDSICNSFFSSFKSTHVTFIAVKILGVKLQITGVVSSKHGSYTISIAWRSRRSVLARSFLIISCLLNFSTTQAERFLVTSFFPCTFCYKKSIHIASLEKFKEITIIS